MARRAAPAADLPTVIARPLPTERPSRLVVEDLRPAVDGGRYPVKRAVGEVATCSAAVVRDGHEVIAAALRWQRPGEATWHEVPMVHVDEAEAGVRWAADLEIDALGRWTWTAVAWTDALGSWRREVQRKAAAGQTDLDSELAEGAALLRAAAERAGATGAPPGRNGQGGKKGKAKAAALPATTDDALILGRAADTLADPTVDTDERVAVGLSADVAAAAQRHPDRTDATEAEPQTIVAGSPLGRTGAWYELFPRSWGGLAGVRRRLPALAELGFDVLYLPPIHPIGRTNRKGRNNALTARGGDPGSPWAIGDATGGHTAVHPELGTVEDLEALAADARALGLEVALDLAIQCSADHPWLTEHPEWFFRRPDGTLKYAENPPKKYQDIYNVDFDCADWPKLWHALLDVVTTWIDRGIRVFRVDNPHTKPLRFWQWLIDSVHDTHPDVVFLAEAFTNRAMMQQLAKVGFDQSYTYFTWKQSRHELTEYVTELATSGEQEYFRPNFFTNTPDILTEELQHGGPPKFVSRLVLAATLSPSYGIYSGYESFEGVAVAEGSEEYLDSEKYEAKERELDGPLLPLVADLNRIRRAHPALQQLPGTRFLETENEGLVAYVRWSGRDVVLCVVCLDPAVPQEGICDVPGDLGLPGEFDVVDELTGERFRWQVGRNYVRLVPGQRPAHVLTVVPS